MEESIALIPTRARSTRLGNPAKAGDQLHGSMRAVRKLGPLSSQTKCNTR